MYCVIYNNRNQGVGQIYFLYSQKSCYKQFCAISTTKMCQLKKSNLNMHENVKITQFSLYCLLD